MKKITFLLAMLGVCDSFAQDTIQIEINDKAKVVLTAQDRESMLQLKSYDFNKIIKGGIDKLDTLRKAKTPTESYIMFGSDFEGEGFFHVAFSNKRKEKVKKEKKRRLQKEFIADLGINNYTTSSGSIPDKNSPYRLRGLNSTYVGVGQMWYFPLFGDNSPVSLRTGILFDWYNFKFIPQNYLYADSSGVRVGNYENDFGRKIEKSKLVVSYLQIPLLLRFRAKIAENTYLRIGVGGYVGYRLGGRTKVNVAGEKIKERDDFYMNNWRYGLEGNLGINSTTFFIKYDLNRLFIDGKAPQLTPFSVGIRI